MISINRATVHTRTALTALLFSVALVAGFLLLATSFAFAAGEAPVANDDSYSVMQDTALVVSAGTGVLVNDTDVESDPLEVSPTLNSEVTAHGVIELNADGSFTYTPEEGYVGEDMFEYTAFDGESSSNRASVVITIQDASVRTVTDEAELEEALGDEEVETIIVEGTIGDSENFTAYDVTRAVTIEGGTEGKIYGALIIKTNGVTVDGLTIYTRGGGNGPLKTAIDVIAKNVTITNNTFELPNPLEAEAVGNGVTIWPYGDGEVDYDVSGNTFLGYDEDTENWSSSALQIAEGINIASRFNMPGVTSEEVDLDPEVEKALALGNTYVSSTNNYVHSNWTAGPVYKYVLASTEEQLQSLEYAGPGATILFGEDIVTTETITIEEDITIDGNGKTLFPSFTKTSNTNNTGLLILADGVTVHDLTIDGTDGTNLHGVHVYLADNVVFEDVTLKNNKNAGMVVNGSTVTVVDITTDNNGWGGINVDQGSGVTEVTTLTVDGTSSHTETTALWRDDNLKVNVTVVDTNSQYDTATYIHDETVEGTIYTLKPEPVVESGGGGGGGGGRNNNNDDDEDEDTNTPEGEVLGAETTNESATPRFNFTASFGLGSNGPAVTALQQILIDGGYLTITAPTGFYGPLTVVAVKLWQEANGIVPATGFVGPLSLVELNAMVVAPTEADVETLSKIIDILKEILDLQKKLQELLEEEGN